MEMIKNQNIFEYIYKTEKKFVANFNFDKTKDMLENMIKIK